MVNAMETKTQIEKLKEEETQRMAAFATEQLKNVLQLFDPEKIPTRTTSVYSRENLRTYLRNPATDANNKSLRKLSAYLYTASSPRR